MKKRFEDNKGMFRSWNKMKNKKYLMVGTVLKSNGKIVETEVK